LETGTLEGFMFSSCRFPLRACRLLLLSEAFTACGEVTSLELHSPGNPDSLRIDLSPGPIEAPERIPLDELLQMRVGVRNDGDLTAGPGWVVRVLVSSDPHIDPFDHQVDQFVTTRELPPGGQDLYLRNKKLSGLGPGEYYIGSMVDVTEIVPELSETNNTLVSPSRITLLPEAPEP
jgi:hypothetical protein